MFSFVRAAGYAAAVLAAAMAPTFADPSLALGVDPAPTEASYIDHAVATLEAVEPQGDPVGALKTLAHDIDFSTQVAEHAVATVTGSGSTTESSDQVGGSLASLVDAHGDASVGDSEMECLAGAIYFESKGEPLAGQLAVAEVIINRTKSGKYPTTLCGVVKQPSQFSFVRGGRMPPIAKDSAAWRKAVAIAHIASNDLAESPVPSATSFHATYVSPRWRMKRLATVGRHVFYR
jgi:spore germination cell wall hydrolase CwlJ-like protein